jgi:streptomycin 6-kinase
MKYLLNQFVQANLAAKGEAGARWRQGLAALVKRLEAEWQIQVGAPFPNATEAFVAEATARRTAEQFALKIPIPGTGKTAREAAILRARNGEGYVHLVRHDPESGAMLLERLGPQLAESGLPARAQLEIICRTLKQAWAPPAPDLLLPTGAEKATEMAGYVRAMATKLDQPCSDKAVRVALRFAEARANAFSPASAVMAHGDPHVWNTLQDLSTGNSKFVDPDGLFVEPAYDLAISMREGSAEFLAGDAVSLGRARAVLLAQLSGVEQEPIWQWGFLHRLVNGLLFLETGPKENAAEFIAVAEAWAEAEPD